MTFPLANQFFEKRLSNVTSSASYCRFAFGVGKSAVAAYEAGVIVFCP